MNAPRNRLFATFGKGFGYHEGPRSMVEGLEERTLFSVAPAVPVSLSSGPIHGLVQALQHRQHPVTQPAHQRAGVLPISISNVSLQNGQLIATGKIGANPFTAPVTLSLPTTTGGMQAAATTSTPILNLQLGPIHLDLLGLNVDTSKICLGITAQSGPGNLLGNLLTSVANLLNGGTSLGNILGGLTSSQLTGLLSGLTGLLNGVLGNLTSPTALQTAATSTAANTTQILNLSLAPVHLNLLGLNVNLDNCAGGPVTLDVTAVSGPGNLLGNLLGGLAGALNGLPTGAADQLLARLTSDILRLV